MKLTNPHTPLSPVEFEKKVGAILAKQFEFGVLSRVPIFNANSKEEYLFGNELDHLLHFKRHGRDHLVLVECKNQGITCSADPRSRAPQRNEKWFVHYPHRSGRGMFASEVREQMRTQVDCLRQFLQIDRADPSVQIECWAIHRRKDCQPLKFNQSGGPLFRALNDEQLV